ncbi:SPOR domain-containing protein [Marinigracilibium pacificum]|nr:SPOR domain-containing protein [Marinigracilibium pacificum]
MEKILRIAVLFSLVLFFQCAGTSKATSGSGSGVKVSDDLSQTRPSYEVTMPSDTITTPHTVSVDPNKEVSNDVTAEVNSTLESITDETKKSEYINGFTVQVYSGRDREKANKMKGDVYNSVKGYTPKVIFDEPNFKVLVGEFYEKLEAHELEAQLKKSIPTAIIVPHRIKIK